jgi:hypothetical protein
MKMIPATLAQRSMLLAMLLSSLSTVALADTGYEVAASKTYSSRIKLQQPIDVNLEVNGVKLDSVFFDKEKVQAFVILLNRTPSSVSPKVGISLFDAKGKLLATGVDVTGFSFSGDNISAGDQKNIELSFGKFINDYKNVNSFQLVFSLGKVKAPPANSKPSSANEADF